MPLQNRVTAFGEIVAASARGTLTGNRGALAVAPGRLGAARWRSRAWIACSLSWKDVRRTPMRPGTWTELFFLDEATAFAAGHRPCALCRRGDFRRFRAAWRAGHGLAAEAPLRATEIDAALHAARIDLATRAQRRVPARLADMPEGAMIARAGRLGEAFLVLRGALLPWSLDGYGARERFDPHEPIETLTPEPVLAAFAAGYRPALHDSAVRAAQ